jgi:hypothetical protein
MKIRVRASVTVEVEIPGDSIWSGNTTIDQIHKQALDDFHHTMSLLNKPSVVEEIKHTPHKISIIGEPKVHMVITDEDTPTAL